MLDPPTRLRPPPPRPPPLTNGSVTTLQVLSSACCARALFGSPDQPTPAPTSSTHQHIQPEWPHGIRIRLADDATPGPASPPPAPPALPSARLLARSRASGEGPRSNGAERLVPPARHVRMAFAELPSDPARRLSARCRAPAGRADGQRAAAPPPRRPACMRSSVGKQAPKGGGGRSVGSCGDCRHPPRPHALLPAAVAWRSNGLAGRGPAVPPFDGDNNTRTHAPSPTLAPACTMHTTRRKPGWRRDLICSPGRVRFCPASLPHAVNIPKQH